MRRRRRRESPARAAALDVLLRVGRGGRSNTLLADLPSSMETRDRALATELVYGVLRRRLGLDRVLAASSSRPLDQIDPGLLQALRLGAYQILLLTRVPDSAAVDTTVDLVRSRYGEGPAAFANAVLRAAARRGTRGAAGALPDPAADPVRFLAEKHSFPEPLLRRHLDRLGFEECEALLEAMNRPAPTVLRPAKRSGGAAALMARLAPEGVSAVPSPVLPQSLRVTEGVPAHTAAFREGLFYIQDEASQIVGRLLQPLPPGGRVLDLCAAPGGKILQIADEAGTAPGAAGLLVAADRSLPRLRLLRDNAARLGAASIVPVAADAARPPFGAVWDRVLLDAPCSGTGIIRRHPEIRWRRTPADIAAFAAAQKAMLGRAAGLLAPGGRLVYAVCSLEEEEGEERIDDLLAAGARLDVVDARRLLPEALHRLVDARGFLRTLPHRDDTDGFFAAVLEARR